MPTVTTARAHAGMILWVMLVGASFPLVGSMTAELPPLLLTAIRFGIAVLALLPAVWRAGDTGPSVKALALYGLMGLCLAGFFGAMFWAAPRATSLSMSLLYVSVPALAYLLGTLFGVERGAGQLLGILLLGAIGAGAIGWAASRGGNGGLQLGPAELTFFAGCVASALYPVLSKWGLHKGWLSPRAELRTFWSLLMAALLVGAFGLTFEAPRRLATLTLLDLAILVYLGVFSSGMTFWLTQRALGVLTPAAVTAYTYLVPLVSMLLLFARDPEQIGWRWLPGTLLVALAIALLLRQNAPRPAHAPQPTVTFAALNGRRGACSK